MGAITQFGAYTRQELEAKCENQAIKIAALKVALKNLVSNVEEDQASMFEHDLDAHAPESCALCSARAAIAKATETA